MAGAHGRAPRSRRAPDPGEARPAQLDPRPSARRRHLGDRPPPRPRTSPERRAPAQGHQRRDGVLRFRLIRARGESLRWAKPFNQAGWSGLTCLRDRAESGVGGTGAGGPLTPDAASSAQDLFTPAGIVFGIVLLANIASVLDGLRKRSLP